MFVLCKDKFDIPLKAVIFDKNKEDHMAVLKIKNSEYAAKFNSGGRLVYDNYDDYENLYMIYDDSNLVGFFKLYEQQANELSFFYIILPMYSGRGYGARSISLIKEIVVEKFTSNRRLVALVDKDNLASIKAIKNNQGQEHFSGFMRGLNAVFITIPLY